MKLLTRYLIRRLSVSTLLALFALLALYSFLDLINEVGSKICDATALEIEIVHVDIQALPIASGKLLFGIL